MDGYGHYDFCNGQIYEGNYVKDQKQGYGSYFFENGAVYKGEFWANVQDGSGTYVTPEGNEINGIWKDGKLVRQSNSLKTKSK
jgi:1-phosphatidylinositol-4-phosphate 5-kinase